MAKHACVHPTGTCFFLTCTCLDATDSRLFWLWNFDLIVWCESSLFLTTQFAVSEEELWRAVLSWAKRSSGVSKPTNQWTEKDNDKIREVRCNKHVRNDYLANLMLIASIDSFYIFIEKYCSLSSLYNLAVDRYILLWFESCLDIKIADVRNVFLLVTSMVKYWWLVTNKYYKLIPVAQSLNWYSTSPLKVKINFSCIHSS